jgi:hypothetical protein
VARNSGILPDVVEQASSLAPTREGCSRDRPAVMAVLRLSDVRP